MRVFLGVSLVLTIVCVAVEIVCRGLHWGYPYTWPLMPPGDPFRDFYLFQERFRSFHTADFFGPQPFPFLYPAGAALIYRAFFFAGWYSTPAFLAALCAMYATAAWMASQGLIAWGVGARQVYGFVAIVATTSYPFWFDFQQANIEWVNCALVGGGVWMVLRGRGYTAASCFGVAASIKIYPLVFLALVFSRRQYRQVAFGVAVAGLVTLVGLWLMCPQLTTSWRGVKDGLDLFRRYYVLRYEQTGFDHSLPGAGKALYLLVRGTPLTPRVISLLVAMYVPVAAFAAVLLYFDNLRRMPMINQVMCLAVGSILLPPVSYDYTLLGLYVPCWLLMQAVWEAGVVRLRGATAAMVCLAVLLAPETEVILRHQSYGGQIKCAALIALLVIAFRYPFPSSYDSVDSDGAVLSETRGTAALSI